MRFKLEIEMSNAAFERRPFDELRNVIDSAISKLATDGLPRRGQWERKLFDVNGNTVGFARVEED